MAAEKRNNTKVSSQYFLPGEKKILIGLVLVVLTLRNIRPLPAPPKLDSSNFEGNGLMTTNRSISDVLGETDGADDKNKGSIVVTETPVAEESAAKSQQLSPMFQYAPPNSPIHNATRVIAMINMGEAASKSILVERCVMSLRTRGNYQGLILLLTDAPPTRFQEMMEKDPNFIAMIPPRPETWNWNLPDDMPYKRFKTFLLDFLDYIPQPYTQRFQSIQFVYYLDIDIVAGQPLQPWFHHVEQTYVNADPEQSQLILFEGNYVHAPLQGGQFILQRKNRPNYCLERWRHYIDHNATESKDQRALLNVLLEIETNNKNTHLARHNCTITVMPKEPYLHFLQEDNIHKYLRKANSDFMNPNKKPPKEYATLMHIKNTQTAKLRIPNKKLRKFFTGLLNLTWRETNWIVRSSYSVAANHTWSQEQLRIWSKMQNPQ